MTREHESVKEAILGKAFPELLYDSDPDIELYFDLRSRGRSSDALEVYNNRLKAKYPDQGRRVLLLSHYRTKDPRYRLLLRQSALELAASIIERIKRNIRYLSLPMEGVNNSDAYRLLKAVEQVVRYLPPDRFEAQAALDNYKRYAELLDFKRELMARTAELGKEYLFESHAENENPNPDFMERSRKYEEQRREHRAKSHFDLSRINFDPVDVERIILPPSVARKEDKVIGYCYKYWNLVNDQAFERIILLYSRKYRTFHYDVYRAVKIGRLRKFTDDEILNTVSTVLSSSYSYSVQGDLYMQTMWRRFKANLSGSPLESGRDKVKHELAPTQSRTNADKPQRIEIDAKKPATMPIASKQESPELNKNISRALKARMITAADKGKKAVKAVQRKAPVIKTGSVSDIVKKLSGRSYDVYHDVFMVRVRPSIRTLLSETRTKSHGIFDSSLNEAEAIVHAFLAANYDNPFMDWEDSAERARVEGAGYSLPSIVPIIEHCYRKL